MKGHLKYFCVKNKKKNTCQCVRQVRLFYFQELIIPTSSLFISRPRCSTHEFSFLPGLLAARPLSSISVHNT
jgi:hypothetical protein